MTTDTQLSLDAAQTAFKSRDYRTALNYWQPLAEQGNPAAQFWVGMLYECGWGVEGSFDEAAKWWSKSAAQGHAEAQFNVGMKHLSGEEGLALDHKEAYFWLSLAVKAGYKNADRMQKAAARSLSPQEITSLDKRVAAWKPTAAPAALAEKKP